MGAAVKGGFWPENGVNTLNTIETTSADKNRVAKALRGKGQRALRAIMAALNGVAPGANAAATVTRVTASDELGGARPIETQTLINRATTAADVADIADDILTAHEWSNTPPANLDGNPLGTR